MDPLIAEILAQPQEFTGENAVSYVTALRNSLGAMKAAAVQRVTIDSNMGENVSALLLTAQNLVQQVHPAALAIILFAQIDVLAEVDYRLYLNMCNILFRSILKDHVKFVFKEISAVSNKVVKVACRMDETAGVVAMLEQAVRLTAPSPMCLTPSHCHTLQACIAGQMYTYGVSFLERCTVLEVDVKATALSSADFLKYFYYAGICRIGVKDFAGALDCFQQCITTPANVLSHIVCCAVKKAKLVSLIAFGTALTIEPCTPSVVSRFCKTNMPVYDEIVRHFLANDRASLEACVEAGTAGAGAGGGARTLAQDGNLGLARQAVAALTRHRVTQLMRSYVSLSLQDIAQQVDLPSAQAAEKLLLEMVQMQKQAARFGSGFSVSSGNNNGLLLSTIQIDDVTGFVRFSDSTGDASVGQTNIGERGLRAEHEQAEVEVELQQKLQTAMVTSAALSDKMRQMKRKVLTSANYIKKITTSSSSSSLGAGMGMGMDGAGGLGSFIDLRPPASSAQPIDFPSNI